MKIKHLLPVLAGFSLIALASLTASAQVGRLEGDVVKADTKEPIVGAEVQIERTDIKGSYPVKTDKKGHFLHAGVPFVGTYTIMVSAPGCQPDFAQGIRGSQSEPLKFELRAGDGKKLTLADVKGIQANAPKGGQQMSAADQKKAQEEYEKKRAEIEAKNKKAMAEHENMKKFFEQGQQLAANKDYSGAITAYNEAGKLDAEQQAIWANLALAYYNRGVTNYNESTKDPSKRDPAKQDFSDAVNAISKALALVEPNLNDPAKGADAKKSKGQYLKIKADSESLLARRLGVMEMAEPANKDYLAAAELSANPADKKSFAIKGAETLREAGKNDEAVVALNAILAADPENIDALYNLGLVYSGIEKTWQDAANMLQKFVDKAPPTDTRVADAKSVIGFLIQGNNIVLPKSGDKKKAPAKKKP
ncbi:MAG: carboxypeptidase regulatory-like domain-containing protein [Blastocatellales bacterium]